MSIADYGELLGYVPYNQGPLPTNSSTPSRAAQKCTLPSLVSRPFKVLAVPGTGGSAGSPAVLLSAYRYDLDLSWRRVLQLLEVTEQCKETVRVRITGANARGLTTSLCGLHAFIPYRHLTARMDGEPQSQAHAISLVGSELEVAVLEAAPEDNRLILSQRVAEHLRMLRQVQVGALVWGTVAKVLGYGAVLHLDIPGIQALLLNSRLSQLKVTNVTAVLQVGDRLRALVVEADPDLRRVAVNTALLEQQPGDMLSDREAVFAGAEQQVVRLHERRVLQKKPSPVKQQQLQAGARTSSPTSMPGTEPVAQL